MKKFQPFLLLLILLLPFVALRAAQGTPTPPAPAPRLEITGVNASQMPTVTITANVYDNLGQPVRGLTAADFALTGDLSGAAQITSVENISDDNLPFAVVLAIDVSTSMAGTPLKDAKQAAQAFIANIGANDPVAIITFANTVRVSQDYTTDKAALSAVIDSLQVNGATALYQGAYEAVLRAAQSPTPRRAVILLSDGAEYGGQSQVGRTAAADQALVSGVPVYTIGLGFGADRSFMEQLSTSTNAHFHESPTSDELKQIYTDLAAQLRSQYVLTLNAPLPLDGTQYNLGLQVTTPQGTADASAVLRAPIPVPIVRLAAVNAPISASTDIAATILADDPLTSVTFQVSGQPLVTANLQLPYVFTINPVAFAPGDYTLTSTATDSTGDTGADVINFTVAALPSEISLSPDLTTLGAIATAQTISVQTSGQTATTAVSVDFDGSGSLTDLSAPYSFTIDPLRFKPGNHTVTVSVTNAGGVTSSQTFPFRVAPVKPQITVIGLQDGQSVDAPVNFSLQITSQTDITETNVSASEFVLTPAADGTYTLDPMTLAPGANTLIAQVTDASGQTGTTQVNFVVAALPPQIIVNGLTAGETLHQDRAITLDFVTQSPVIHVAFFVDGQDLAHEVKPPYGVTLGVLDYTPGAHTLRIIADAADAQETTLDIPFTIAPEPAATATATTVFATQAAGATATQHAVTTAAAVQATQAAHATSTEIAHASSTAVAVSATAVAAAQATQSALAVQATQASIQATATQEAQATANAHATATQRAQATQFAQATATRSAFDATATQVKIDATATQAAQNVVNATATQVKIDATETQAARVAATQIAQVTQAAGATQNAVNATATQSSIDATATHVAQATQNALHATATRIAQATINAQATATESVRATQNAQATATQRAELTATAQVSATEQAILAATGNARTTQQAIVQNTGTAVAQIATATANRLGTQVAGNQQATQTAESVIQSIQATQSAVEASATQAIVNATAARAALATQSAGATASQAAQATQNVQATATQSAGASATLVIQATHNAQATISALMALQALEATRASLATANAQAHLSAQATQDSRATRSAAITVTAQANATATVVQATQVAQANMTATVVQATQVAQQTLSALEATATQVVVEATATRHTLETQTAADATATQTIREATATVETQATSVVANAAATQNRGAQLTVTAQQLVSNATATAVASATAHADTLATNAQAALDAQGTSIAAATATAFQQATIDTRLTAIGPTATALNGGAQGAATVTPQPSPTLTEIQAQQPPISSNVAPIAIVVIVILVIIVVLVLIMRGGGSKPRR